MLLVPPSLPPPPPLLLFLSFAFGTTVRSQQACPYAAATKLKRDKLQGDVLTNDVDASGSRAEACSGEPGVTSLVASNEP